MKFMRTGGGVLCCLAWARRHRLFARGEIKLMIHGAQYCVRFVEAREGRVSM